MIRGNSALISCLFVASTDGYTAGQPRMPKGVAPMNSPDGSRPMRNNWLIAVCLFLLGCFCCSRLSAQFRQPLGIYARDTSGCPPVNNPDQCLTAKAAALVANPAVAGIDAELSWSDLNPSPGVYTWNELEDIFSAV